LSMSGNFCFVNLADKVCIFLDGQVMVLIRCLLLACIKLHGIITETKNGFAKKHILVGIIKSLFLKIDKVYFLE
jgi:hypothetical protein